MFYPSQNKIFGLNICTPPRFLPPCQSIEFSLGLKSVRKLSISSWVTCLTETLFLPISIGIESEQMSYYRFETIEWNRDRQFFFTETVKVRMTSEWRQIGCCSSLEIAEVVILKSWSGFVPAYIRLPWELSLLSPYVVVFPLFLVV